MHAGAALFAAVHALPSMVSAATSASSHAFRAFDGTMYKGKPNLSAFGFSPIVGTGNLWDGNPPQSYVSPTGIREAMAPFVGSNFHCYLDIENWPVFPASPADLASTVEKMTQVLAIARTSAPTVRLGFYGIMPSVGYWPVLQQDASLQQWRDTDTTMQPLAALVDDLYPSLYTFYNDPTGWVTYARAAIAQARTFGKPVYPFLMKTFHPSNQPVSGLEIPATSGACN